MHTLNGTDRAHRINDAIDALRGRMNQPFIDVDEAFAQLASELHWQSDDAAWGLRRARRLLRDQSRTKR